jgi:hypothetical protein
MPQEKRAPAPDPGFARSRARANVLRAYEHLAHIDILEGALAGPAFCDVSTLAALALAELNAGRDSEAADILCVAERLCFAAQIPDGYSSAMRNLHQLPDAIAAEFETLMQRTELFRLEPSAPRVGVLPEIVARTVRSAREAFADGLFSRALELAHAAELLAEIALRTTAEEPQRIAS